jgi:hypothetical protein
LKGSVGAASMEEVFVELIEAEERGDSQRGAAENAEKTRRNAS